MENPILAIIGTIPGSRESYIYGSSVELLEAFVELPTT